MGNLATHTHKNNKKVIFPWVFDGVGLDLDHLGACSGHLGPILEPICGHHGPSWSHHGPTDGRVRAILEPSWEILGPPEAIGNQIETS